LASQTVYYDEDFTDGAVGDDIGLAPANPGFGDFAGLGLRTQQAWRNAAQSYYGPTAADAFDQGQGFGTARPFVAGFDPGAGAATLNAGNVWVFDISMISDVAVTAGSSNFLAQSPGVIAEWNFLDPLGIGGAFARGGVAAGQTAVSRSTWASAYPNGEDTTVTPNTIPTSLTDVALPAALNGVLRTKVVFQEKTPGGLTRVSKQALNNNVVLGSGAKDDGAAGSFRSNYGGGLFVQLPNNSGDGNVTYAAGHGGGATWRITSATPTSSWASPDSRSSRSVKATSTPTALLTSAATS
jgi:hypothetical protein